MNPKSFLRSGGIVLIVLGALGFVGVLGPTPEASIFRSAWWFDPTENWAHIIIGIIAVVGAFAAEANVQRPFATVIGVLLILLGFYGMFSPSLLGANLENPPDSILHLVIGIWALLAARGNEEGV